MNKSERNKLALFISDLMISDQQGSVSHHDIATELRGLFDVENELSAYEEVNKIESIVRSIAKMFSLRCSPLALTQDKMLAECRSFSVCESYYDIVDEYCEIKFGGCNYLWREFEKNDSFRSEFQRNFAESLRIDEDWIGLLKEHFDESEGYYKFMTGWYDGMGKQ